MTIADVITWIFSTRPITRGDLIALAVVAAWAGQYFREEAHAATSWFWVSIFWIMCVYGWLWAVRLALRAFVP